jgi:hypothetical protein
VPVLSISQAVRVEADGLIILPCPGGDRIIRRPVQFDRVYSIMTGLVAESPLDLGGYFSEDISDKHSDSKALFL